MSQLSDPKGQQFVVVPKRTTREVAELVVGQDAIKAARDKPLRTGPRPS